MKAKKDSTKRLAEQYVKAVRLADKYEGRNFSIYANNRNKANELKKKLIALDFDFSRENLKTLLPHLF